MRILMTFGLMILCLSSAVAQTRTLPPPMPDSVTIKTESSITAHSVAGTDYWKVTLLVDYVALGDRALIAQVYNPRNATWIMMSGVAGNGQFTSGDSVLVAAGQGVAKFEFNVLKSSEWGEAITDYGHIDPAAVWFGSYGAGDVLKASGSGYIFK